MNENFEKRLSSLEVNINKITEDISGIKSFLNNNSQQLQRFQDGYDFQILKNFVKQISILINSLEEKINEVTDEKEKKSIQKVCDRLVLLLERNDVEQITPEIGIKYTVNHMKYWEVSEERDPTNNKNFDKNISSIITHGYVYKYNHDQEHILLPAKIKLFEYVENYKPSSSKISSKSKNDKKSSYKGIILIILILSLIAIITLSNNEKDRYTGSLISASNTKDVVKQTEEIEEIIPPVEIKENEEIEEIIPPVEIKENEEIEEIIPPVEIKENEEIEEIIPPVEIKENEEIEEIIPPVEIKENEEIKQNSNLYKIIEQKINNRNTIKNNYPSHSRRLYLKGKNND